MQLQCDSTDAKQSQRDENKRVIKTKTIRVCIDFVSFSVSWGS